jgi:hypothetical protein
MPLHVLHAVLQSEAQQKPWKQSPLLQSAPVMHIEPVMQGEHSPPPQSTPVSPMSFLPFEQCAGMPLLLDALVDEALVEEDEVLDDVALDALLLDDVTPPLPLEEDEVAEPPPPWPGWAPLVWNAQAPPATRAAIPASASRRWEGMRRIFAEPAPAVTREARRGGDALLETVTSAPQDLPRRGAFAGARIGDR